MGAPPPCAIVLVVLLPLGILGVGFGIGAVSYRVDAADERFASGMWPIACSSLQCDARERECLPSAPLQLPTEMLSILWITSGIWHFLAIIIFSCGVGGAHHLRNFGVALSAGLLLSVGALIYAAVVYNTVECPDERGALAPLAAADYRLGHLFRILATDVALMTALLVGNTCAAYHAKPEPGSSDEDADELPLPELRPMGRDAVAAMDGAEGREPRQQQPAARWAEPVDPPAHIAVGIPGGAAGSTIGGGGGDRTSSDSDDESAASARQ